MKINNKFAIGCLVQWYEIEIVEEYVKSIKDAINRIENKENISYLYKIDTEVNDLI